MTLRPRDVRLIDLLDGRAGLVLDEIVWRVARDGRDPTDCGSAGGRWDDTTFDVLYTSRTRDGALAEMSFHLKRGQPIVPSRVRFRAHEVRVRLDNALDLSEPRALKELGLDMSSYGRMSYAERMSEYPRTQEIAEVAHFHGHDGLIVPSARSLCCNIVAFCDRIHPDRLEPIRDHGVVNWSLVPT